MKFRFTLNKETNHIYFVSNLSNWHFSCRPWHNRYWIEKTGEISGAEKKALESTKSVFQKHSFGNNYWGNILLIPDKNRWEKIEGLLTKKEISTLKSTVKLFKPRFEIIWKGDQGLLKKWMQQFEATSEKYTPNELGVTLNELFGTKTNIDEVEVILLISGPNNSATGGANLTPGRVTLEISRTPLEFLRPSWLTLWHETIHSVWEKNSNYMKQLSDFIVNSEARGEKSPIEGLSLREVTKEAILDSLIPRGYLAKKYFGFPSDDYFIKSLANTKNVPTYSRWRLYAADKLRHFIEEYVDNKRPLDEKVFAEVIKIARESKLD
ncbi:MAG: hypothetical protein UV74_C0013G0154 [Candidatus Woesebacteria bacterium GW2011_GWB1_43_14]|uniref:DUF2268 domain-containing protein n=1 Tax=Candidatus Woesebacteria bacterium GW2011_GWB1_43_14 TaxID=1618578 RepID=A0A0G1DHG1_9BACT|nr:MAG: hypothetical protein UV51_C0005G0067 [Candidatus Woesebacteria bacterium GW2011_GWC1_42_9]KKS97032.1 MAG: hypothetical protein UV74_C0013G0154 [Candidatus Woesebacteria bacterium GW2011_GWB1_43_14]